MARFDAFKTYWRAYGGFDALVTSWYFWLSVFLTGLLVRAWSAVDIEGRLIWPDYALSIGPSFISFSLGAMAILLAFSNDRFLNLIQEDGADDSYFLQTAASLFHFILMQSLSVLLAIACLGWNYAFVSMFSFLFCVYGILVAVAAASNLLDLAEIMNKLAGRRN